MPILVIMTSTQAVTSAPTAPLSLQMRLARKIAHNVVVTAALLTALMAFAVEADNTSAAERPVILDAPAVLVEKHDCWTGPDSREPAAAVVTIGGETRYGARYLDRAIAQEFFGVDHGLIVHGFCPQPREGAR